jgi:hypothetical protein
MICDVVTLSLQAVGKSQKRRVGETERERIDEIRETMREEIGSIERIKDKG